MEAICVRLDESTIKSLDSSMKRFNYATRTDFIREAIRDKLRELEKDRAIVEFKRFMGSAKTHVSDKRLHEIREEISRKYAEKFGISLD